MRVLLGASEVTLALAQTIAAALRLWERPRGKHVPGSDPISPRNMQYMGQERMPGICPRDSIPIGQRRTWSLESERNTFECGSF